MCASILLVDDDPNILQTFKMIFRELGHRIRTAVDGGEAMRAVEEEYFDLAVLDYGLPESTGDEVASRLLDSKRCGNVVFLSGHVEDEFKAKMAGLGSRVFEKPVCPEFFVGETDRMLQGGSGVVGEPMGFPGGVMM